MVDGGRTPVGLIILERQLQNETPNEERQMDPKMSRLNSYKLSELAARDPGESRVHRHLHTS